jgi:YHS domain-containing protein
MRRVTIACATWLLCLGLAAGEAEKDAPKKSDAPPAAAEASKKDPKDMTLEECEASGICPVTRTASKPIYHVKLDDKTYHFATRAASKEFQADPAKFGYKKDAAKAEEKK